MIVGSGLIAASHARALLEIGVRPAAVWSPDADRRARFAQRWGAAAAPDLDAALDTPGATHVHICTTPMHHSDPIAAAAARGLTVISEKPLAATLEHAEESLAAVNRHGAPAWVNFNRRADGGIQTLRRSLADGAIGTPVAVFGHYRQQWNAAPSGLDWRYDPTQVGPLRTVAEIGSHWLDLAHFVLGDRISSVNALLGRAGERPYDTGSEQGVVDPPNDDLFATLLRFRSGAVGQVYGTELSHGSFDEIELRVDGTLGSAVWSSDHPNLLRIGNKTSGMTTVGLDSPSTALSETIAAIYAGSAAEKGVATFDEGVSNARVIDAIRRSTVLDSWEETNA